MGTDRRNFGELLWKSGVFAEASVSFEQCAGIGSGRTRAFHLAGVS